MPDMSNSIETAIAIAFFWHYCYWYCYCQGNFLTIAIDIDIAKGVFQLLLLLLVLLRQSQNYCSQPPFLHSGFCPLKLGQKATKSILCGLKQSHIYLRVLLQPQINSKAAFYTLLLLRNYCYCTFSGLLLLVLL